MDTVFLTIQSLLNGFIIGATMFIEIIKQHPWFAGIIILGLFTKSKKHKRYHR